MSSKVQMLAKAGLAHPPSFLGQNTMYETLTGSVAYGVAGDISDCDVYGFCIPPKDMIFPHLRGEILGFGRQNNRFEQYQEHHIADASSGNSYDLAIYSIVKYFQLCMECNPNMIDSLFTPDFCVLHITRVGTMVRESRKLFLHKGSWHKFKGYAYSQLHKMKLKDPKPGSKRSETREKYGFDCKFAYHIVRLLDEAEQILMHGDLDLQRNREQLKAIRNGEMPEAEIERWASEKEHALEKLYLESKLQHSPDEEAIKRLLLACLEDHYGSLSAVCVQSDSAVQALRDIQTILDHVRT